MKPAYLTAAEADQAVQADEYRTLTSKRQMLPKTVRGDPPDDSALMAASSLLKSAQGASDAGVTDADISALAAMIAPKVVKKK